MRLSQFSIAPGVGLPQSPEYFPETVSLTGLCRRLLGPAPSG